jgi:ubiquinone/menaquinone biosynthesis C-methylase UbiE
MLTKVILLKRSISTRYISVHSSALKGFTADEAEMYQKGRPSYSDQALSKISDLLINLPRSDTEKLELLELGSGTGKFTNAFAQFTNSNPDLLCKLGSYIANEPSDGFRASLESSVPKSVKVIGGSASHLPLMTHSTDAVFVAQAFHWMANVESITEIYRVLKSERPLVLIWNSYDYSSSKWLQAIDDEILTPNYRDDTPRHQNGRWKACFQTDEGMCFSS